MCLWVSKVQRTKSKYPLAATFFHVKSDNLVERTLHLQEKDRHGRMNFDLGLQHQKTHFHLFAIQMY